MSTGGIKITTQNTEITENTEMMMNRYRDCNKDTEMMINRYRDYNIKYKDDDEYTVMNTLR